MRKIWFSLVLLTAILLSACAPAAAPSPTAAATSETAGSPTEAATALPASPESTAVLTPESTAPVEDCTPTESIFPSIPEDLQPTIPPINNEDWSTGPAEGARIQLIEYSDFQCPYCNLFAPMLKQFQEKYPDDVQIAYRHFPLSIHDKALLAAQAAEAAGLQGKFFEMHDLLFDAEKWSVWTPLSPVVFETWVKEEAKAIEGLDAEKFASDLTSEAIVAKAKGTYDSAVALADDPVNSLQGTPALYAVINDVMYAFPTDPSLLNSLFDLIDLDEKTYSSCPEMTIDSTKDYTATIKTVKGDIVIDLYADKAPITVNSFVFLAKNDWFDNVTFHRVVSEFVAQTGDPSGSGIGGPGYEFKNEINADLKFDKEGVVGMANAGANTNGSQFFITYDAVPQLDGLYTIFGQVVDGMDVARQLTPRDTSSGQNLPPGDVILDVVIEEK